MNRFLRRVNKRISLGNAAVLLISISLIGQVLGFLRTKLVNANFDAVGPNSTDAYFAAFKIPDLFFFTLAAGALGVAFMPILMDQLNKGNKKAVWELSSSLLNLLTIIMAFVAVVILVFADPLLRYVVAPNLSEEQLHDAAVIMRLIAINPLLFTISGVLTAMQQTFGRFFFYAIAPLFYNLSIIASIFIFKDSLGLIGLGVGALAGAILQLLVVLLGMHGSGFKYRMKIKFKSPDFRLILKQLPARSIDQGVDSINSVAETNFATRLGSGSVTYYENAYVLHSVPIQLVGTTIATAAFPRLTERISQGRTDLFRKDFMYILRVMIWIIMPIVVVSYFTRGYLSRMIFSKGIDQISIIFGFLVVAILFRVVYALMSRWFYAQKDTKTPLMISLFTILLNVVLAAMLSRQESYGVSGLAMAQSIVAAVEVFILATVMYWRDRQLFDRVFWAAMLRILSVTGFSIMTAFIAVSFLPLGKLDTGILTLGGKFAIIAGSTLAVHIAISSLFGLEEAKPFVRRLKRLVLMPIRI